MQKYYELEPFKVTKSFNNRDFFPVAEFESFKEAWEFCNKLCWGFVDEDGFDWTLYIN